jgi:hypothetical protein
MKKGKYQLILITFLVIGFLLSGAQVSFSQQQPPIKGTSKPTTPAVPIKLDISIRSHIQLSQEVQNRLIAVSRDLVTQNLSAELSRGLSSRAETNVIRQTPKGYIAETIVLNLLRNTYTAEMSRIEFSFEDERANIIKIEKIYQPRIAAVQTQVPQNLQLEQEKNKLATGFAAPTTARADKGLVNTPCTEFPSAVEATHQIFNIMQRKFAPYVAKLIGRESTKERVMDFLKNANQLLCWNNIGHGVTDGSGTPCYGLVQWDQTIWHNELSILNPYSGIYGCVILTNSCNSYKDPLNSAIWSRRPRTYIGGNINLHVNKSEFVAVNFWKYTLEQGKTMRWSLEQAQRDKGYPVGTYGLRGDEGLFSRGTGGGGSGGTGGGSGREDWPPKHMR